MAHQGRMTSPAPRRAPSLLDEIKTLLWLQWRLTRAMFRSRRGRDRQRMIQLLLLGLQLVFVFPLFVVLGAGFAVGLILLSERAAYEVAMIANTFILLGWLLMPSTYSSQFVERFEMSQLFTQPISFRGITVGSTLISIVSVGGLWTAPILLGEVIGLAWHRPLALPMIALGALVTFGLLVLTGRLVDDLFDLVAGDRRLRALMIFLLSMPFIVLWIGQYYIQYNAENLSHLFAGPLWDQLSQARGASEFLEILRPSRLLIWLPSGWVTASMGLATIRQWLPGLGFLGLSLAFEGFLFWLHDRTTRRLMRGEILSLGAERVRGQRWTQRLPGPPALRTLFHKDWLHLLRSPLPRRLVFVVPVMTLAFGVSLRNLPRDDLSVAVPLAGLFIVGIISLTINVSLTANYFGSIDREGFATLAQSPVDRRHVFLSANLVVLIFVMGQYLLLAVLAAFTGLWMVLPLGLYMGLFLQISSTPAYNLASIIGPYRAQVQFRSGRQRGNLWGMLAWAISVPPILGLVVVPYIFWRPGLVLTLPLGAIYSVALYGLTLKPLARLLQRREHAILEAITTED